MSLRICIVALNALPAIDPAVAGPIGGIETRAWLIAQGLAKNSGVEVDFVVRHATPLSQCEIAGVHFHLIRDRFYAARESLALRLERLSRFPWIKLRRPRPRDAYLLPAVILQRLWNGKPDPLSPLSICLQIPADVYLTFGVQRTSAQVISAARSQGKKSVLLLAHDSDVDERMLTASGYVSPAGDSGDVCRWILGNADLILCQTHFQEAEIRKFGREAIRLRNPVDLTDWSPQTNQPVSDQLLQKTAGLDRYALWIGRADRHHKQPEVLLRIARLCPEIQFLMVMNPREECVERFIRSTAPSNVRIVERVPFPEMPEVMRHAQVLVNTSASEGFPNTFLQAAACGVPVASFNVESDFLSVSRAGWCAEGDETALAKYVQSCWHGDDQFFDGVAARHWVEEHHDLSTQARMLEQLLRTIVVPAGS